MKENVNITAVITTYRREKKIIERAVKSVLSQTLPPSEILVIDDNRGEGSEIYSSALAELSQLSNLIHVIRTEGGHGAQKARNTGIKHARGEYIAFLDDDDEWLPEKLEKQTALLKLYPDAGLCCSAGYLIDETMSPPDKREMPCRDSYSYEVLLRDDGIGTTTQAMIPAFVFKAIGGFDESLPARQDYEMWIRIAGRFPVIGTAEPLFKYHMRPGEDQISHKWLNCVKGHKIIYRKYRTDIDRDPAAKFNVVFHVAHYEMIGAKALGDRRLMARAAFGYFLAFMTYPPAFFRQGLIRMRKEALRLMPHHPA